MDTLKLEYFIKVYENNNLTRAAEELYITQPALSQAMSSLEKELQCKLFERDKKHLRITAEGKLVYGYAKRILSSLNQMKEMILNVNNEKKTLKIKSIDLTLPRYIASKYILACKTKNPQNPICSTFTISGSTVLSDIESLKSGVSDIVITNRRLTDKDIECIPLFEEKTYVNLPKNSPYEGKNVAMLKDFENRIFLRANVLVQESDLPEFYNSIVLNNYLDYINIPIKFNYISTDILYYMWNETDMYMFSSRSSNATLYNVISPDKANRVMLLDDRLGFMYYLAYKKDASKLVKDFTTWLTDEYKVLFNGMNVRVTEKDY